MKRLLTLLLVFIAISSFGQRFTVSLFPTDVTVCYGGKVTFQTNIIDTMTGSYTFKWLFNGVEITDSVRKYLSLKNITNLDSGYYRCVVTDTSRLAVDTSNPGHLRISPSLHIDTLYRYNALSCPSDSNGQMKVKVSGGIPPYNYSWGGGSYHQLDTIGVGFPKGTYLLTVTDSGATHCISREFTIETLVLHKIIFHMTPPDTVYLGNPEVTVTIPDSCVAHLDSWNWDFGDKTGKVPNLNPCQHAYAKQGVYNVLLNFTDIVGGQLCDSTIVDTMTVKTIRLFIPNVITPGSGDDNGSLNIREMDKTGTKPYGNNLDLTSIFLSTEMYIFNRQGKKVYQKTNYVSGDFDGGNLSSGVYYYLLKCHGENGDEVYRGALTIIRN
ncbi:MAG: gliding motility-associated C-terminal domain-containing protein [Bacteroidetes bacterium]|nr:gliding motility-associated C-terminal domain-containing protein [Bacteroidota bacterium]